MSSGCGSSSSTTSSGLVYDSAGAVVSAVTHLVGTRGAGVHAGGVTAVLRAACGRQEHPDPEVEARLATHWDMKVKAAAASEMRLFNATKFRLCAVVDKGAAACDGDSAEVAAVAGPAPAAPTWLGGSVTMCMGITDYREYVGTNMPVDHGARLVADGEAAVRAGATAVPGALPTEHLHPRGAMYLGQPLGVGAILRTSDGFVLLIKRSSAVAEAAGMVDVPGGHAEPSRCGIDATCPVPAVTMAGAGTAEAAAGPMREGTAAAATSTMDSTAAGGGTAAGAAGRSRTSSPAGAASLARGHGTAALDATPSDAIVREFFWSMKEEVIAEINLPEERLSEPLLLGFVANATASWRPAAAFEVAFDGTLAEAQAAYAKGGTESEESTALLHCPVALLPALLCASDGSAARPRALEAASTADAETAARLRPLLTPSTRALIVAWCEHFAPA